MLEPSAVIAFRKVNGLSQAALAEMLGVDQATVSRIETGSEPSKPIKRLLEIVMSEKRSAAPTPKQEKGRAA